jgi:hypothetical protein
MTPNTEQPIVSDEGSHACGVAARVVHRPEARQRTPAAGAARVRCGRRGRVEVALPGSLQHIFEQHFDAYASTRTLHPREWRAAQCIRGCYTGALGAHVLACPNGHVARVQPHACRHRSCPRCAEAARARWIDAEFERLLPCAHFHVVFTLPHALLALWEFNRAVLAQLLFDCTRASLLELLADPRHLGATPGLLMSLHTWGRTLSRHPHVHCLVTAGGLDAQDHWRSTRAGFLLPLAPLQRLFRGKLLGALGARLPHGLTLPPWTTAADWRAIIRRLYRRTCNLQICPPYEHGRGVVLYLARYAKGGPCPKDRALHLSDAHVRFSYTDHRDARTKSMALSSQEFIARILWHAPPRGQHTTRHAGLYSSSRRRQHLCARLALHDTDDAAAQPWPRTPYTPSPPQRTCAVCRATLLRSMWQRGLRMSAQDTHRRGEFYGGAPPAAAPPALPSPSQRGPTRRSSGHPPAAPPGAA